MKIATSKLHIKFTPIELNVSIESRAELAALWLITNRATDKIVASADDPTAQSLLAICPSDELDKIGDEVFAGIDKLAKETGMV